MALYSPTNMSPSMQFPEESVVDQTFNTKFSCSVYGTSKIVAYRFRIYRNEWVGNYTVSGTTVTDSSIVKDTGIIDIRNNPLFIQDNDGNPIDFEYTLPANSIPNNATYKWCVDLYWVYNPLLPAQNRMTTSNEALFICRRNPAVSIVGLPNVVKKRRVTIIGGYVQENKIPISRFYFEIFDISHNCLAGRSETLTGGSQLKYVYDNLLPDTKYYVQLHVTTADGKTFSSKKFFFTVDYGTTFNPATINLNNDCENSFISGKIERVYEKVALPKNENYTFEHNQPCTGAIYPKLDLFPNLANVPSSGSVYLALQNENNIQFLTKDRSTISIRNNSSFGLQIKLKQGMKDVLSFIGQDSTLGFRDFERKLYIENDVLIYSENNELLQMQDCTQFYDKWCLLVLSKSSFKIKLLV